MASPSALRKKSLASAVKLISSLIACGIAAPTPLIVDQSNTIQPQFGLTLTAGFDTALGEEFFPELPGLSTVTVDLSNFAGTTGTAAVYIRAGLDGPTIGISEPVNVPLSPDRSFDSFDFVFATTVNLTPGSSYVLQVNNLTPQMANLFLWGNQAPNPPGHAVSGNHDTPYPCCDFYFLEGLGQVPEPLSWLLTGSGVVAIVVARLRYIAMAMRSKGQERVETERRKEIAD
jgi:hypothetical protein